METNWNLQLLYKGINDPQMEIDIKECTLHINSFIKKWKNNKDYTKDPKTLHIALKEYEKLLEEYGILSKPSYYIGLQRILDQENPNLKAKENKLNEISIQLENSIQFFVLNISKISKKKQKEFLNYKPLNIYKHLLEKLFKSSKYLLSDSEEKIFNIKSKTSYTNWVEMIEELLSKQTLNIKDENNQKKKIPYNGISKYLISPKKEVREYAAKEFLKVNRKYAEIGEFEINSILQNKKDNDIYRKIPRADLTRFLNDDIDTDVVDTLVDVCTQNFDIPQRFYKLKAKFLNQKYLRYYERNLLISLPNIEYKFKESFELVKRVFFNLDPEFAENLNTFLSNGQYDVYPQKNKSGGASCIDMGNKRYPTYILLNHNDELNDVLTLAHESGHGIHSIYSNNQSVLNSGHSTATAEVASTFFEDFTLKEIFKNSKSNLKKSLMFKKLDDEINTIFRQIAFFNFEKDLHQLFRNNGYISLENINNCFVKHMSSYCGNSVKADDHMKYGWLYWGHLRMYFYVYSYASGFLISKALQSYISKDREYINTFKTFLKSGSSKSPKELFKQMNIDISKKEFWEQGISEIRRDLEWLEAQP